jgi:two-component system, NtrC family, response regulator AtoC
VVMSNDAVIDLRHLPQFLLSQSAGSLQPPAPAKNTLDAAGEFNLHALETNAIRAALATARGNRTQAADLLGVSRRTLQRKLKELGI